MNIYIDDIVQDAATKYADRPCITHKGISLSFGSLEDEISQLSTHLSGLGLSKGDRVLTYMEKCIFFVISAFAAMRIGAIFVPVNPNLKANQVKHIITDCCPRFAFISSGHLVRLKATFDPAMLIEHIIEVESSLIGAPKTPTVAGKPHYRRSPPPLITRGSSRLCRTESDIAAIFYTSGSTGYPKGVALSHRNLIAGAESVSFYLNNNGDDVILSVLPFSFDAGFSQITTGIFSGAHIVLCDYLYPQMVPDLCQNHCVTGITSVPSFWIQILKCSWDLDAAQRMRYIANTGGHMPSDVLSRLRRLFPNALPYLMYGTTEAFRSTFLEPAESVRRPNSIGKPIPNAEVLVLRPDGTKCAAEEVGELVLRGPLVAAGYWGDREATERKFRHYSPCKHSTPSAERAVFSGDLGYQDEEGYLYFVGRDDAMIKTMGYRVSPTEVEDVAYSVQYIRAAAALGVPDSDRGQKIALVVSVENGAAFNEEEVIKYFQARLPTYMIPGQVHVFDELPLSPNGKIDRVELMTVLRRRALLK